MTRWHSILSRQDGAEGVPVLTLEAGKESSFAYFSAAIWEGIAAFLLVTKPTLLLDL
ncbi:hypothetical protein SBA4_1280034 [Candidatus Sulfopaludibacter sp. SbA4]|nr:hypothetical protein SBA4_1280034 [Candidatus Sulfopaludibacter sp. SbA4]